MYKLTPRKVRLATSYVPPGPDTRQVLAPAWVSGVSPVVQRWTTGEKTENLFRTRNVFRTRILPSVVRWRTIGGETSNIFGARRVIPS